MIALVRHLRRRILGIRGDFDITGRRGERAAATFLRRAGYRVIARNVHVEFGELDLLCLAPDRRTIVAVEVKTRRLDPTASTDPHRPAFPAEAKANAEKRRKVLSIVRHLARANGWADRPLRVDVVGVDLPLRGRPAVRHHVNVPA
ncbi:MAG: YraN family protein [Phycisphaerales bacterium]